MKERERERERERGNEREIERVGQGREGLKKRHRYIVIWYERGRKERDRQWERKGQEEK